MLRPITGCAAVLFAASIAVQAPACTLSQLDPNAEVANPKFYSANRKFVAVVRAYPRLGDFDSARPGDLDRLEQEQSLTAALRRPFAGVVRPADPENPDWSVEVVLYRVDGRRREPASTFRMEIGGPLLVSNDGRFIVSEPWQGCNVRYSADDVIRIFDEQGVPTSITVSDVLTANDLDWITAFGGDTTLRFALEETPPYALLVEPKRDGREPFRAARVDLGTARVIGDKLNLLPPSTRIDVEVEISGRQVVLDAARAPAPDYPHLARQARIAGVVVVNFAVDATGRVQSTNVLKLLPFGVSEAAEKAVRTWRFDVGPAEDATGTARIRFTLFPKTADTPATR